MKIRYKIALTILPLILMSVFVMNLLFGMFYKRTVVNQERGQIQAAETNIAAFVDGQSAKYIGAVDELGHRDDTYQFLKTKDSDFVRLHMSKLTFTNLDISFAALMDSEHTPVYQQYFSVQDQKFTIFPGGITDMLTRIAHHAANDKSAFGIYKLGMRYYFVALTFITDSAEIKRPNGTLIIGRQIDENIINEIEKISACTVISLDITSESTESSSSVILENSYVNESGDSRTIKLTYVNPIEPGSSVQMTLSMPRDRYLSEMSELKDFSAFSTAGCLIGVIIIFILLNRYLSKPFTQLVSDIKAIDMTKNEFERLPEGGSNEFSFLRKSINTLLGRIESDQKKLIDSKEELYATLVSVGDGVIVVDKEYRIKFMNPVAQSLTGWDIDDTAGISFGTVFNIISEYTRLPVENPVNEVFRTDAIVALSNHTLLISKDGTERAIEDTAAPIKNASGETNGCIIVFKDTSEKKEIHRRIEYLSYHDQLTGLYNRRFFENELKKLDDDANLPLSIIYADVNGLKIINDAFGHESGDKIIQQVSEILSSVCREEDIIARVGGDEFVTLLPRTGEAEAEAIVEQLREKTDQLRYLDIELSISFGWDTKYDEKQQALDVLRNAEDIMYQKKLLSTTSKRNGIIKSILTTLHLKCPREEAHSIRVSSICESIGTAYNLNTDDMKELVIAGELHDIGKIAIDEAVLNKADTLTPSEWLQIKHHPEIGFRLLGATSEFNAIAEYVLAHHEKWDGTGYPKGLKGNEINWKARVISVADSYDAMTCDRPYRKALAPEVAAAEIKRCAGTQFDPDIARVFVEKVLKLEW